MMRNILVIAIPCVVGGVRKAAKPIVLPSHSAAERLSAFIEESPRAAATPDMARAVEMLQNADSTGLSWSNITDKLTEVIQSIETNIVDDIMIHHNNTQTYINLLFDTAANATDKANTEHNDAVTAFSDKNSCSVDEKADLAEFENQQQLTAESQSRHDSAKAVAETAANISATMPEIAFNCDASEDINCTNELGQFETASDDALNAFNSSVQSQIDTYIQRNATWQQAIANLSVQNSNEASAWSTFTSQTVSCDGITTTHNSAVCTWASAEQGAQTKIAAYQQLVADVNSTGNLYSELDRTVEFSSAKTVICLLSRLIQESEDACGPFTYGQDAPGFQALDLRLDDASTQLSSRSEGEFIESMMVRDWTDKGTQVSPVSSAEYSQTPVNNDRASIVSEYSCSR